jgi:hypothetical protein
MSIIAKMIIPKTQPIQSGLRTQIQDHVITLHNLSPTKRTVGRVPNSPDALILIRSICLLIYDYI